MQFNLWDMEQILPIIGWFVTAGEVAGVRVATFVCKGMVREKSLVGWTARPKMVMHARETLLPELTVASVAFCPRRLIQQISRLWGHHPALQFPLQIQCQLQFPAPAPAQLQLQEVALTQRLRVIAALWLRRRGAIPLAVIA